MTKKNYFLFVLLLSSLFLFLSEPFVIAKKSGKGQKMKRSIGPAKVQKGVKFIFRTDKNASKVYLAGDFNDWAKNDGGKVTDDTFLMTKVRAGLFEKVEQLSAGQHAYKFVVEGEWQADPAVKATDKDGNSLIFIAENGDVCAYPDPLTLAPKKLKNGIQFSFFAVDASKVYLAGSFNNWANNDNGNVTGKEYEMKKKKDGIWVKTIKLSPGEYKFKYVIGGSPEGWRSDPASQELDQDGNSILVITTDGQVKIK
ncbi:MAG: glycogen-binding domain-containing protein [Spirochaetes bacterium]|nr:glycogen-binding domain-containing protein [Spirochaetota bacterium]